MLLSADGQELYFLARYALAGTGKKPNYDIWRSRRVNGEWAMAELVGPPISTAANELYPVLGSDGSLYFNSDRNGKYLFFSRWFGTTWATATDGEVYWVDARILNQFRDQSRPKGAAAK